MCGLFAFVGREPPEIHWLERIAIAAAARGPHSWGVAWRESRAGAIGWVKKAGRLDLALMPENAYQAHIVLGHARLATSGSTDVKDAQPLIDRGRIVIHNGNIPRYPVLRSLLRLKTNCDSEVLLHADEPMLMFEGVPFAFVRADRNQVLFGRRRLPLFAFERSEGVYLCSRDIQPDARLLAENEITVVPLYD